MDMKLVGLMFLLIFLTVSCKEKLKQKVLGKWLLTDLSATSTTNYLHEMTIDDNMEWMTVSLKGSPVEYTTTGKYEINGDSLIFYKKDKRWDWGKIVRCNKENLVIETAVGIKRWEKAKQ